MSDDADGPIRADPVVCIGTSTLMPCVNCQNDVPTRRYHVYLDSDDVVELELCEGCRYRFVTATWVSAVV